MSNFKVIKIEVRSPANYLNLMFLTCADHDDGGRQCADDVAQIFSDTCETLCLVCVCHSLDGHPKFLKIVLKAMRGLFLSINHTLTKRNVQSKLR